MDIYILIGSTYVIHRRGLASSFSESLYTNTTISRRLLAILFILDTYLVY